MANIFSNITFLRKWSIVKVSILWMENGYVCFFLKKIDGVCYFKFVESEIYV